MTDVDDNEDDYDKVDDEEERSTHDNDNDGGCYDDHDS